MTNLCKGEGYFLRWRGNFSDEMRGYLIYGMVESVGIIYPDCPAGNKHVPGFGEVIVRTPLTLEPVAARGQGFVQVCSVLPTSFPGHLLLTEDRAKVIAYDGCACGRRGISFRFAGRIPKTELRGCGNLQVSR